MLETRFWAKVQKTPSCWLWTGAQPRGYGQFAISQKPTRTILAHRFAYELMVGPIPDGEVVHHNCRTKHCVNPAHLSVHPRAKHIRDHHKGTHCRRGHPFDLANTYITPSGPQAGKRNCRICQKAAMARYKARR